MQVITSKDNDTIKEIKKLRDNKKFRDEKMLYIVEGIHLIEEAIKEHAEIEKIVICEDYLKQKLEDFAVLYGIAKYNCIYVSNKIFDMLSDVVNPQGILAVIKQPINVKINYNEDIIMILDNIQDPGNLGTIIRTADAIGLSQILVTKNGVDMYNPKVIRATMGGIFRVRVIEIDNVAEIKKHGYKVVATSLQTKKNIYDLDYNKYAIIIGNEANGVSKQYLEYADVSAKIPMPGKAESLNAAVASSVIMYEYVRKKILKKFF